MLGITQTDPFGISLFVSAVDYGAFFALVGEGTTLSSNARAVIGAAELLVDQEHVMRLRAGTTWYHNGLIEIGANNSNGLLALDSGASLSGGLASAPNLIVHAQQSQTNPALLIGRSRLVVGDPNAPEAAPAILSLTDLTLDGRMTVVRNSMVFAENIFIDSGGNMNMNSLMGAGHGRVAVTNALIIAENTSGQVGDSDMRFGDALSAQSVLVGGKANSRGSLYISGPAVFGTDGNDRTSAVVVLGRDASPNTESGVNAQGEMILTRYGGDVTVHGTMVVGQAGTGRLAVSGISSLTINGELKLASANSTAVASLEIGGASTVSAQMVYVGTNDTSWDYGGALDRPSPAGSATVIMQAGSTLNVPGWLYSYESFNPFTGQMQTHQYDYAGVLKLGANSRLEGSGTIAFPGVAFGTLSAIGTIDPGYATSTGHVVEIGEFIVQGNLVLNNGISALSPTGGTLRIDLGGTRAGEFDVLRVTGEVDLRNATLEIGLKDIFNGELQDWMPYDPVSGTTYHFFVIESYLGSATPMFSHLVDLTGKGLTLANISLVDGGLMLTIPATAVPEPSTYAMLVGLGALGFVWAARRHGR
jgi:hypothetical protein